MEEKVYKTMKSTGIVNIVLGIVTIAVAVGAGITFIVNGARLLKNKSDLMF